jgi:hypothetical protein
MSKIVSGTVLVLLASSGIFAADSPFGPLWKYQGTWKFTVSAPGSAPVSNKIQNDCADIGQFFLCQQTVDKTKYYRITNVFSEEDRIHFERSESLDGATWKVLASGIEVRASQAGTRPEPPHQ